MVKFEFSKLAMGVRFPLLAPTVRWCNGSTRDFDSLCIGSNPVRTTIFMNFYNIAIGLTFAAGLVISVFYGMLAGVAVNLALYFIVEKFLSE